MDNLSKLFHQMEDQLGDTPGRLLKDYAPIFLVDTLRKQLETGGYETEMSPLVHLGAQPPPSERNLKERTQDLEATFLIERKPLKKSIKELLIFANRLRTTPWIGLNETELSRQFCSEIAYPPIELVWLVGCSKYKLFGFSSYVMSLKSELERDFFVNQMVEFCFSSNSYEDSKRRKGTKILNDFLPEIIIAAYCNPESNDQLTRLKKNADEILAGITWRLVSNDQFQRSNRQLLLAIFQGVPLPNSVKKKCFLKQLEQILCEPSQVTQADVLRLQEKYAGPMDIESPGKWETISSLISDPPELKREVLKMAEELIKNGAVNWETLLLLITVAKVEEEQYSSTAIFPLLKEVIRDLLSSGLSQKKEPEVLGAFILARHCCLISPQNFERYEKWYVGVFGNEVTSLAKAPEEFTFLASVLSDAVQYDPICFLQVHASYWPFVPPGTRSIWNDYVTLSKARISEYNEVEQAMEYEPNPNNPIQHDIERILKSFDSRQRIPEAISEMLMFRKPYYYEQFLPALLRKPYGVSLSDGRLRLIEALNASGKIPHELYATYKGRSK